MEHSEFARLEKVAAEGSRPANQTAISNFFKGKGKKGNGEKQSFSDADAGNEL